MKTLDIRVLKSTAKNVLFIQLRQVIVAALGMSPLWQADSSDMWDPDRGPNPGSLHWGLGVPATGSPGKSPLKSSF